MKNVKPASALATILFLAALLPGCAVERKCGPEGCPGDAKITANVQAMINQLTEAGPPTSHHAQPLHVGVDLTGGARCGNMKETAEAVAKQYPGVSRVVNNIFVGH